MEQGEVMEGETTGRAERAILVSQWTSANFDPQKTALHVYTILLYMCVMHKRVIPVASALYQVAEEQQGYFTARQAVDVGYLPGSQAHHVKAGNWVRTGRGIYRLARFPQSAEEQLVIYSLWSRNRQGKSQGVYSHQTALSIHELSDINPTKLHMTVPPTFRRSARVPAILVLHHTALDSKDVEQRQGFRVTRPLRTIIDLAATELVSRDIIAQALAEGRNRGLITASEFADWHHRVKHMGWFEKLFSEQGK
jgi:predicted transcriptional regulator of viral defense system